MYHQPPEIKGIRRHEDLKKIRKVRAHANAMLPQVTALALSLGTVFNGALLTEIIFSYPGMGLIMRTAASAGDYNVLYGAIAISIIAVATAGLVIDLIYPLLDPRIRHR